MRLSALFVSRCLAAMVMLPGCAAYANTPTCTALGDAQLRPLHDACLAAHVYNVVTVENGTRFLDVCSPQTEDAACRFSIVSYSADRNTVGDLDQLRGKDIEIRGPLQRFGHRYLMVLNDDGQLHHRPAPFRPDPRLLAGFSAEDGPPPNAPELKVNFHHHGKKLERE